MGNSMTPVEKTGYTPLSHSDEDLEHAKSVPDTPQTRAPTYRLAWNDPDFMTQRDLRPVRLQLELLKTGVTLAERGIRSTVVMFGGARLPEPGGEAWAAKNETQKKNLSRTPNITTRRANSRSCARSIRPRPITANSSSSPAAAPASWRPAIAAPPRSARRRSGSTSCCRTSRRPTLYVTPELCFNFHYFAIRKMHFVMRAKAVVVFPGGFGTLDEFFETLTLIQTGRMERVPVILFGKEFSNTKRCQMQAT